MGHCPDLSAGKGFKGAEWPDVGFPLGDGRLSFTDGQTRFTGGLMATNLIMCAWQASSLLSVIRLNLSRTDHQSLTGTTHFLSAALLTV